MSDKISKWRRKSLRYTIRSIISQQINWNADFPEDVTGADWDTLQWLSWCEVRVQHDKLTADDRERLLPLIDEHIESVEFVRDADDHHHMSRLLYGRDYIIIQNTSQRKSA